MVNKFSSYVLRVNNFQLTWNSLWIALKHPYDAVEGYDWSMAHLVFYVWAETLHKFQTWSLSVMTAVESLAEHDKLQISTYFWDTFALVSYADNSALAL